MWQRKILNFMQIFLHYIYIFFLVKILLAKLKNFLFSMLECQSWKSKIVTKMWRLKRWWYLSKLDYNHHMFDFVNFYSCPVKLQKNLKLTFRSKFNHGFTIIVAIYKVLFEKIYTIFTLLTMSLFFGAAHRLGGPKTCLIYLTMMTLPKEDRKYVSVAWHITWVLLTVLFHSPKISKFCYTKKYRYRLDLNT